MKGDDLSWLDDENSGPSPADIAHEAAMTLAEIKIEMQSANHWLERMCEEQRQSFSTLSDQRLAKIAQTANSIRQLLWACAGLLFLILLSKP